MVWASHDDDTGCVSVEIRHPPLKKRCSVSSRAGLSRYYAAKSQSFSCLELAHCTQYGTSALGLAKRPSSFDLQRHASSSPTQACAREQRGVACMITTHEEEDDGGPTNHPDRCPCNDTIFADPSDAFISPEGSPLQLYGECSLADTSAPQHDQQQQQRLTEQYYGLLMPHQHVGYGAGCSAAAARASAAAAGAGGSATGTPLAPHPVSGSGAGALWQSCAALLASGCSGRGCSTIGASSCSSGACGYQPHTAVASEAVLLAGLPSVQLGRSRSKEWRMNMNSSGSCCSSGNNSSSSSFSRGHADSQGRSCCDASGKGESCSLECSSGSSGVDCTRATAAAAAGPATLGRGSLGAPGSIASAATVARSLGPTLHGSLPPSQAASAGGGGAGPGSACMRRAGLSRQRHATAARHLTTGGAVAELSGLWGSTEDLVAALSLTEKRHPQHAALRRSPQPTRPQGAAAAAAAAGSGVGGGCSSMRPATGEGGLLLGPGAQICRPHHQQHQCQQHQQRPDRQEPAALPQSCVPHPGCHPPAPPACSLSQQQQQQHAWQPAQAASAWSSQATTLANGWGRAEPWGCGSAPAPTSMAFFGGF